MMHNTRRWVVSPVASIQELAQDAHAKDVDSVLRLLRVEGHPETIFLNDATHEDGAAEFEIARLQHSGKWIQLESITFSWTDEPKAAEFIRAGIAGEMGVNDLAGRFDTPEEHRRRHCRLCA